MSSILHSIGSGNDEIQNVIERATSGMGTPMLAVQAFDELLVEARARSLGIVVVEVYELVDNMEVPALELGLYYDEIQNITADLPDTDKVTTSLDRAQRLSLELSKIGKNFGLQVWLE